MLRRPAIESLRVQNLFSFGEKGAQVELGPLNLLIGPNASGKSNLIEAIGLLKGLPNDFAEAVAGAGGVSDCLWKGAVNPTAKIDFTANVRKLKKTLCYQLSFMGRKGKAFITDESVTSVSPGAARAFLAYKKGRPTIYSDGSELILSDEETDPEQSVLSQRKDSKNYPEITYLGRLLRSIRIYSDWEFGPGSTMRDLYGAEGKNDYLDEDVHNLGLMLNRFYSDANIKPDLLKYLNAFYAEAVDIHTLVQSGLIDTRVEERKKITIPASRLSDGTLRWLALLTILLHPSPPPLVCLEEPELGLHPDALRMLAELLTKASERMQLIVTTHSDALVDEFTDSPDSVIVFEKENGSTKMTRLNKERLTSWLERYSLGQLWRSGEIGGNRW
jgi:predicted ATPase